MLPITIGIAIGIIVSFQTAVNSRLRSFIGSPYQACSFHLPSGPSFWQSSPCWATSRYGSLAPYWRPSLGGSGLVGYSGSFF